jgi:hypothetical protein
MIKRRHVSILCLLTVFVAAAVDANRDKSEDQVTLSFYCQQFHRRRSNIRRSNIGTSQ